MVRGCTNSGHPLIQYSIVSGIYDRFAEMRRAAMPMQLIRNLEDTCRQTGCCEPLRGIRGAVLARRAGERDLRLHGPDPGLL